jgi:hypothetical protein
MKTQEEIEQIAVDIIKTRFNETDGYHKIVYVEAYKKGYTQCQEDIADMKYTEEDMRQAFIAGVDCENRNGKNFNQFINSLNKQ